MRHIFEIARPLVPSSKRQRWQRYVFSVIGAITQHFLALKGMSVIQGNQDKKKLIPIR